MKGFCLTMVLVMGSVLCFGQNAAEAKKLLASVSAKMKGYKGVSANFSVSSKGRTGKINHAVSGKLLLKGNKYYIKEPGSEIFSDGNKTWNFNGRDEVVVTPAADDSQEFSPQKLLTDFNESDYSYQLISKSGNNYQVQLTPKDKRKSFNKVDLFIDKNKMMITRARILDKGGNTISVAFSNINTNVSIPDSAFVFNAQKYGRSIEVIE